MGEGDAIKHTAIMAERKRIVAIIRRHKSHAETMGACKIVEGDVNKARAEILAMILGDLGVDPGAVCEHPAPMCVEGPCRACGDE